MYDLQSQAFYNNPYPTFERMRREDPLYWDAEAGMYMLTRYKDVQTLVASRHGSAQRMSIYLQNVTNADSAKVTVVRDFLEDWLVFTDPPTHTRLRKLIAKAFLPRSIDQLAPTVRAITHDVLAGFDGAAKVDVINELAFPITSRVIAHMLGVPRTDIAPFQRWTADVLRAVSMVGDADESIDIAYAATRQLQAYFHDLIAQRRGKTADDLLGVLVNAEEGGTILSEHELVSTCALLMVAGHETTTNFIGNSLLTLLQHPDQLAALRNRPDLLANAVEECARYESVAFVIPRVAKADLALPSGTIPAGAMALGFIPAANRDEIEFPNPDRFDIERQNVRHLNLGHGPHVCLGAALSRLEGRTVLGEVLRRFPALSLPDQDITFLASMAPRGLVSLQVNLQ